MDNSLLYGILLLCVAAVVAKFIGKVVVYNAIRIVLGVVGVAGVVYWIASS